MTITVRELMTEDLITLSAGDDLPRADALMRLNRLRHLPVVEGKKLAGLITHRDLLRLQTELLARLGRTGDPDEEVFVPLTAGDLMNRDVATTTAETPAAEAGARLLKNRFGCLPVVAEDQTLVGIITESDFLAWAIDRLEASGGSAG
ncbi:MAG: CBS domain-containing protein [Myxococcota bacterium]